MKTAKELKEITILNKKQNDHLSHVIASFILTKAKQSAQDGLFHSYYVLDELYEERLEMIIDILTQLGYTVVHLDHLGLYINWDDRKPDHIQLSTDNQGTV